MVDMTMRRERRNRTCPRVSVIVPTRNEAGNLPLVFSRMPEDLFEVILVDGHSTDGTIEVAQELRPDIRVVHQEGRGKGDALALGFLEARGDIAVTLDADGSADPQEIPRFVAALVAGADFAKGSRFLHGAGSCDLTWNRRLGNKVLCTVANRAYGAQFTDLCYGYNAVWTDCIDLLGRAWPWYGEGPTEFGRGFEVETVINVRSVKNGLVVWEVPSYECKRQHGNSNLNALRDGLRVAWSLVRESPGLSARRVPRQGVPAGLLAGILPSGDRLPTPVAATAVTATQVRAEVVIPAVPRQATLHHGSATVVPAHEADRELA